MNYNKISRKLKGHLRNQMVQQKALALLLLHFFSRNSHLPNNTRVTRLLHRGFFSGGHQRDEAWSRGFAPISSRSIHANAKVDLDSMSMETRDYYDILGVNKNADSAQIKKAYYHLAKKLHPDTNRDDTDAEMKFQEILKVYEVLKDDDRRCMYDQVGHDAFEEGGAAGMNAGINDIIKDVFAREFGGKDVQVSLELSFMEAIQGCSKTLSFQTSVSCEACGGTGVPPGTRPETCKPCRGSGVVFMPEGISKVAYDCVKCGGSGKNVKIYCKCCKGIRVVKGSKTVKIAVPSGIDNNETVKMVRSGGVDPDGNHRDLFIAIKVKEDPVFRRDGADIHVDAVLSATQAIRGGTIQVPTLTGDSVLKVHPGTQPGQKVILKRKGIKARKSSTFGDQYVHFNVITPT